VPRLVEPAHELPGQIAPDPAWVAGLAFVHGPDAVQGPHHRHGPAEQVDVQALPSAPPRAYRIRAPAVAGADRARRIEARAIPRCGEPLRQADPLGARR
jgi:hypothetical protein